MNLISPGRTARRLAPFVFLVVAASLMAMSAHALSTQSSRVASLHGNGTADGGFEQTRHRDTGSGTAHLVLDDTLIVRASLTFQFDVDSSGNVKGTGTGEYSQATWTVSGTRGGNPVSCSPTVSTGPFTVVVTGSMRGGLVTLRFDLPDAQETTSAVDCGSGYQSPSIRSRQLNSSLKRVVVKNGLSVASGASSQTLRSDVDQSGGEYPSWLIHDQWDMTIQPPACPSSADAEALQKYGAASRQLGRAERAVVTAEREYATWRLRGLSALAALRIVVIQSSHFEHVVARDPTAAIPTFWSDPKVSPQWLRRKVRARITLFNSALGVARSGWTAADRALLASSVAATRARLLRTPCEPNARILGQRAARRSGIIAKKRRLIGQWKEATRAVIPDIPAWNDAESALQLAEEALPNAANGSSSHASLPQLQRAGAAFRHSFNAIALALKRERSIDSALNRIRAGFSSIRML